MDLGKSEVATLPLLWDGIVVLWNNEALAHSLCELLSLPPLGPLLCMVTYLAFHNSSFALRYF
jgi:hypothetical protein